MCFAGKIRAVVCKGLEKPLRRGHPNITAYYENLGSHNFGIPRIQKMCGLLLFWISWKRWMNLKCELTLTIRFFILKATPGTACAKSNLSAASRGYINCWSGTQVDLTRPWAPNTPMIVGLAFLILQNYHETPDREPVYSGFSGGTSFWLTTYFKAAWTSRWTKFSRHQQRGASGDTTFSYATAVSAWQGGRQPSQYDFQSTGTNCR